MWASVAKSVLYTAVSAFISSTVVSFPIFATTTKPHEVFVTVSVEQAAVSAEGILYDAVTGAFLYDAVTGRPLVA